MLKTLLGLWFITIAISACKSNNAELKATPEQREKLRSCITTTIQAVFPETEDRPEDVKAFALEMAKEAPKSNDNVRDPAFDAYIRELGCDPNAKVPSGSLGTTIVERWILSPYFKEDIGPGKVSSTPSAEHQR